MKCRASSSGFAVALLFVMACGPSGMKPSDGGADAGAVDARSEARLPDATVEDASVPDATLDAMLPELVECDPMVSETCAPPNKCSVVRRYGGEGETVEGVLFACTPGSRPAEEGVICSTTVDATPWDLTDRQLTDNCAHGLVCANPDGSLFPTCQRLCRDRQVDCGGNSFCEPYRAEPRFGLCRPVSDCDPVYQRFCPEGLACYPVTDTRGDLRGICRPYVEGMGAGGICRRLTECLPGSICLAEGDAGPGSITSEFGDCERLCDYSEAYLPALIGDGPGGCPSTSRLCAELQLDEGAEVRLPLLPGICR